jgi:pSer/pThr/pTyr-binding forkhead associated (FHA) protein
MIDEKPRSAAVTAVTTTVVSELRRGHFFNSFQAQPQMALALLRLLSVAEVPRGSQPRLTLEGITPRAAAALPVTPFEITQFPFRIGRQSPDPLIYNDLMLPDSVPLQVSRHHLALIAREGRVGVVDRGSTLGSWVDGQQLGGRSRLSGPLFFAGAEGILVLGNRDSPFRYRVSLRTEGLRDAAGNDS